MKRRTLALLLALAVTAGLCALPVLAEDEAAERAAQAADESPDGAAPEEDGESPEDGAAPEEDAPSPAGPDQASDAALEEATETKETTAQLIEKTLIQPEPLSSIAFQDLESRVRERNLNVLILEESVQTLEELDYGKLYSSLRDSLNGVADAQWALTLMGQSFAADQLNSTYDSLRDQFESIRDGELQRDNAGTERQLKNLQDQIVMSAEMLYVTLADLEVQEGALERQREALNRTVEELELRYELGQISALQLKQAKAGRSSLESGLQTLRMNIKTLKLQFEQLIGAEQTGTIALEAVPAVTESQVSAMAMDADYAAASAKSYALYEAAAALEDARDDYRESGKANGFNDDSIAFQQAKHTWQAAQYTYNDAVQGYELKFRTLYSQVQDYYQVWAAAKTSLACEQSSCAASELKYQQGALSKNALLDARDKLEEAEEAVRTARDDLFSSYNTYRWAVEHGILN